MNGIGKTKPREYTEKQNGVCIIPVSDGQKNYNPLQIYTGEGYSLMRGII